MRFVYFIIFCLLPGTALGADHVTLAGGIACLTREAVYTAHADKIKTDAEFRAFSCLRVGKGLDVDVIYEMSGVAKVRIYADTGQRHLLWMYPADYENTVTDGEN